MFGFQNPEVAKLKVQLAEQRRIAARLRRNQPQPSAQRRILDQALEDATKLIDMRRGGEPTGLRDVAYIISRRRFAYAMALLKSANIVRGGGRGEPYRWRGLPHDQMDLIVKREHELILNRGAALLLVHTPNEVRKRVQALSPTEYSQN